MDARQRRLAVRVARGFLLVALALGVYGMHTLGHLDGRHSAGAHHLPEAAAPPSGPDGFVPGRDLPGFDPTSGCLAVLTSFLARLSVLRI